MKDGGADKDDTVSQWFTFLTGLRLITLCQILCSEHGAFGAPGQLLMQPYLFKRTSRCVNRIAVEISLEKQNENKHSACYEYEEAAIGVPSFTTYTALMFNFIHLCNCKSSRSTMLVVKPSHTLL